MYLTVGNTFTSEHFIPVPLTPADQQVIRFTVEIFTAEYRQGEEIA